MTLWSADNNAQLVQDEIRHGLGCMAKRSTGRYYVLIRRIGRVATAAGVTVRVVVGAVHQDCLYIERLSSGVGLLGAELGREVREVDLGPETQHT